MSGMPGCHCLCGCFVEAALYFQYQSVAQAWLYLKCPAAATCCMRMGKRLRTGLYEAVGVSR